jgi:hypothetical protein
MPGGRRKQEQSVVHACTREPLQAMILDGRSVRRCAFATCGRADREPTSGELHLRKRGLTAVVLVSPASEPFTAHPALGSYVGRQVQVTQTSPKGAPKSLGDPVTACRLCSKIAVRPNDWPRPAPASPGLFLSCVHQPNMPVPYPSVVCMS